MDAFDLLGIDLRHRPAKAYAYTYKSLPGKLRPERPNRLPNIRLAVLA